ncbi:MAG: hypothetical protein ACFFBZ_02385 [Promethearchaeota archaeon]
MDLKDNYIINISKQTGLSRREIEHLIAKKQQDLKEISKLNVLYVICKEFAIDVKGIYESFQI